jgi:hypothetical protein
LSVNIVPQFFRPNLWLTALVAWGCLVIICVTIYWNLAVGYGWTLPLIGTVKGPPTPFQQGLFTAFTVFAALLGFGVSFRVFLKGSWLQRLAILVPLLLFLGVLGSMTYEAVNQILVITSEV